MEAQHAHGLGVEKSLQALLGQQAPDAIEEIRAHDRADRGGGDDARKRHRRLGGEESREREDELTGNGREHVLEKDEARDREVTELADEVEECFLHVDAFLKGCIVTMHLW